MPLSVTYDKYMEWMHNCEKKMVEFQEECMKLKFELDGCRAKIKKLQEWLINDDIHRGQNTMQSIKYCFSIIPTMKL